jgi:hypothetical protein
MTSHVLRRALEEVLGSNTEERNKEMAYNLFVRSQKIIRYQWSTILSRSGTREGRGER